MAKAIGEAKKLQPVKAGQYRPREEKCNDTNVYIPEMKFEDDATASELWQYMPRYVQEGALLHVYANDHYRQMLVSQSTVGAPVQVVQIVKVRRPAMLQKGDGGRLDSNHRVRYGGDLDQWIAERVGGSNPAILGKNLRSEEEAIRFILDHATNRR